MYIYFLTPLIIRLLYRSYSRLQFMKYLYKLFLCFCRIFDDFFFFLLITGNCTTESIKTENIVYIGPDPPNFFCLNKKYQDIGSFKVQFHDSLSHKPISSRPNVFRHKSNTEVYSLLSLSFFRDHREEHSHD